MFQLNFQITHNFNEWPPRMTHNFVFDHENAPYTVMHTLKNSGTMEKVVLE